MSKNEENIKLYQLVLKTEHRFYYLYMETKNIQNDFNITSIEVSCVQNLDL